MAELARASMAVAGVAGLGACTTRTTQVTGFAPADPEHQAVAEYNLGLDAINHGDFRNALAHARRATQLDDQNARAAYLVSTVDLAFCDGPREMADPDCRLADAEVYARKAVKLAPQNPDAKTLLGQILINEEHYPEAIELLRPLTTDPSYTSIHLAWGNLGWAQVLSGDIDGGITSLKNSVTEPRFCVGHYHLGIAYEKKADLAQADAALTAAIGVEECKNFQAAYEERGKVRQKLGKADASRSDFEHCKALAPDTLTGKRCAAALAPMPLAGGATP
jgi:Tfp pilus assembly protein PilF